MQGVRSYSPGHGSVNTPGWLWKPCSFCPPPVCPPPASLSLAHPPVCPPGTCSLIREWMPHGAEEGALSRTPGGEGGAELGRGHPRPRSVSRCGPLGKGSGPGCYLSARPKGQGRQCPGGRAAVPPSPASGVSSAFLLPPSAS